MSQRVVVKQLGGIVHFSEDMLLTSQSWLHPSDFNSDIVTMSPSNKRTENKTPTTININTCRPMSYQEEGAKVNALL